MSSQIKSNYLKNKIKDWTSGNEKIDDFIQEIQLKIELYDDIVFEWIPYDQFNEIKETGKNCSITVYSAIWKDGPLYYNYRNDEYTRDSNMEVALKILHDSQNSIEFVINEAKKYSTNNEAFLVLHGISQNPDTNDYILVQNNSINITNWISSGNEKIDDFIQKVQLKVIDFNNTILEWIPYNQFNIIKLIGKNNFMTIYSAIWKNGPLHCNDWNDEYTRDSNKEVTLKFLHNLLQDPIESVVINESFLILYGISQNPDTNDYILVQNNSINLTNWISGNEKIDYLIQEMQLKVSDYDDTVLEWIPYDQLNRIEETEKNSLMTVYSAIWRNGPLHKKMNPIDFVVNEVKKYSIKKEAFLKLYGISLNPDTNNYILIQNNPITLTNWISKNEKIDYFIQEMHLNIRDYNNAIFEWIPYNQFNKIEETGKNSSMTIYSAIWKDGPLYWKNKWSIECSRDSNKEVCFKIFTQFTKFIEFVINEAKKYSTNNEAFLTLYGISQNPNTNNYILVQDNSINFTNWISGNEKLIISFKNAIK
ncbi:unnamed protein product, partial [Rhizophagus irregularis]